MICLAMFMNLFPIGLVQLIIRIVQQLIHKDLIGVEKKYGRAADGLFVSAIAVPHIGQGSVTVTVMLVRDFDV